jgi:hypothetical protein
MRSVWWRRGVLLREVVLRALTPTPPEGKRKVETRKQKLGGPTVGGVTQGGARSSFAPALRDRYVSSFHGF